MNLRNNNSTITIRSYAIAQQLVTVYEKTIDELSHMAEGALQAIGHSSLAGVQANQYGIMEAFAYLDAKLESIRKTVSFWDSYQIYSIITDPDTLGGQLAQLPNNSSLINNSPVPFQWIDNLNQSHYLYQGDIILKDYLGYTHVIPATNKGFYRPDHVTAAGQNNYVITYVYDTNSDTSQSVDISVPVQSISAAGYNLRGSINPGDFYGPVNLKEVDGSYVIPIVKYFTTDQEQVLPNYGISVDTGRFWVENDTAIPLLFEVK